MKIDDKKLKKILTQENYVTGTDIEKAEKYAIKKKVPFTEYLITEGFVSKDLLGQAAAESFGVTYSDLNSNQPSRDQVLKIPEDLARKKGIVFFSSTKKNVVITTDDPEQDGLLAEMKEIFPTQKIIVTYSLLEDIEQSFIHYQKSLDVRFTEILKNQNHIASELLTEIFNDADTFHTSDIHFEPQATDVLVRFRIDGVLREVGRLPTESYENVLNRIKVQSRLRIDEHFAAQDGSMHYENGDKIFDMRTSIVPTVEGEKVVLRVLAAYVKGFSLEDLGLSAENQETLENAAKKPFGMILVTGPTGSGKTTTLYALLKLLNKPDSNITTIEDPVEYKMVGVNQIQVNPQTNLTFSQGLRSIVRQDPDTILVGEIRDEETAEIAVNAALTGHLLLSTFHSNDAATAIPRLLDMGTEPFLLASTLEVIVAQRLVRKICETCRYSLSVDKKELHAELPWAKKYFKGKKITFYVGKGCDTCGHTGYHGRIAIYEFIKITPELKELVLTNPSTSEIWKLSQKQGAHSLFEDGIEKVKSGITTLDEVMRVAPPPQS
ncbi:MAG: type II secretory ATPase GspE/PulE/Tfp pilus assembly ATPase PilB-like protein [Acidimicrobiales bacterium]|jgi:type II secretory ATPase GspE/PulE/Tfp pilus assembly ATPase PilB-like protein